VASGASRSAGSPASRASDRAPDYLRATRLCQERLGLHQQLGASYGLAHVRYTLGDLAAARGDDGEAAGPYEASLSTLRDLGDRQCIASTLSNLAAVALRTSQPARAAELLTESMALHRELGDQAGVAPAFTGAWDAGAPRAMTPPPPTRSSSRSGPREVGSVPGVGRVEAGGERRSTVRP
jgi:hypothetical protein